MMGGFRGGGGGGHGDWSNPAVRNPESAGMMQVPDRILLAGNNAHVAARSTPRELQLENSVMPTSPEHVRVYTPPRSIRLDDHSAFPAAGPAGGRMSEILDEVSDDEFSEQNNQNTMNVNGATQRVPSSVVPAFQRTGSSGGLRTGSTAGGSEQQLSSSLGKGDTSGFMMTSHPGSGPGGPDQMPQNMTTFEELQLVRRQIAKLNHRLMAVELENQQQQQREMIFTVLVTAYFFGKFVFWVNRNT